MSLAVTAAAAPISTIRLISARAQNHATVNFALKNSRIYKTHEPLATAIGERFERDVAAIAIRARRLRALFRTETANVRARQTAA